MKRICAALLAGTALLAWFASAPSYAAPPTVTPSPGYDARLQEQRAGSRATIYPQLPPVTRPVSRRHGKRTHVH